MTTLTNHLNETTEFLKEKGVQQADFGLILGSGLGELAFLFQQSLDMLDN